MKNNKQPIIVGLDLGTTKTVAIAGRKNENGKLDILGYGETESVGVSNGMVLNVEKCMQSIKLAIEKCMVSNSELDIKDVYVGISGQHIKSLKTHGGRTRRNGEGEISQKDIDFLISDQYKTFIPESDQIIDVIPHDFAVDNVNTVIDPIGAYGTKLSASFNVITGDKNAIKNIKRSVAKAGLNVKNIVLQPLASTAAVTNGEDLKEGVVVLDIGGGTTDMAIYCEGTLKHVAVIPCGGVNVTNDIRNGLGILRSQAELLKIQYGNAVAMGIDADKYITVAGLRGLPNKEISLKMLSIIIEEAMQEIIDYAVYHLRLLHLEKGLNGGIILTGGGAQLKNIQLLTEQITGMDVRIGTAEEYIMGEYMELLSKPAYATCIGLILKAYADFELSVCRQARPEGELEACGEERQTGEEARSSKIIVISGEHEGKQKKIPGNKKAFSGFAERLKENLCVCLMKWIKRKLHKMRLNMREEGE